MGGALASVFGLGESLLRSAARQRQATQHGPEGSGFQVDPHSVSLLEGSQALLRRDLSSSSASPQSNRDKLTCATAVENLRWLQQNRCPYLLTDQLRCWVACANPDRGATPCF